MGSAILQRPRFHYLSYINIPRADMYSVVNSIPLPQFEFGDAISIRDLGIHAGQLMGRYTALMNREELYANILGDKTSLEDLSVGSYWFSQEAVFRSKRVRDKPVKNIYDLWQKQECIIYRKMRDWKLICLIDPRWITTNTAFVTLSSGSLNTLGLFHVNSVDEKTKVALTSPLMLGAPDRGFLT